LNNLFEQPKWTDGKQGLIRPAIFNILPQRDVENGSLFSGIYEAEVEPNLLLESAGEKAYQ